MPKWFRKHRVGYGWGPATWQGWVVVGLFAVATAAVGQCAQAIGQVRTLEIMGALTIVMFAIAAFTSGKDSDS